MKKRVIAAFIAILVAGSAAACSGNKNDGGNTSSNNSGGNTTSNTTTDTTTNTTTNTAAETGGKAPITFTLYNADMVEDNPFTSPVAQKITELTGVTLKFDYPVGGAGADRISLMVNSGDYPDLIYAKGDTNTLYEAGALVQLDNYIETNGQNVQKLYGELLPRLKMSEEDPHYYALGAYGVNAQVWNVESSMPVQNALLKEFGYPKISTIYELEELITQYIAKYPEIDGRKTIGLSLNCDDWHWIIDLGNTSGFLAGYPDNGEWIVDKSLNAEFKFLNDELKEFYRWLNHMYAIGLLDPETFTQKDDDWKAKLANGQVLAIAAPSWEYNESMQTLRNDGRDERTYAHIPITISKDVKPIGSYDAGWSGSWGVGITTKCKDPDRAFEFLDWYCSEEAQVLVNWGLEGEHYTIENGKRVVKPEIQQQKNSDPDFQRKTGVGAFVYPFPQQGDGVLDSTGSTFTTNTPDSIKDNYSSAAKETLAAYGVEMWKDLYPPTSYFELSPFGAAWQVSIPTDSDINVLMKQCDDYTQQTLPKIVIASPENFDKEWDNYIKELHNLNVDQLNSDFTALVKAKTAFWAK